MTGDKPQGRASLFLRLLTFAAAWNLLLLGDEWLGGERSFGFLSVIAYLGTTALAATAPLGLPPGTWLGIKKEFAFRWRWIFWYVGLLTAALGCVAMYKIIFHGTF